MAEKPEPEKIKDLPKTTKPKDSSLTEEELGGAAGGMRNETMGAKTDDNPETPYG